MKNTLLTLCLLGILVSVRTVAQISTPQPSPSASIMQKVGLTDMTINYSRPSLKGRKLFGEIRKYGVIWRTGANQATKLILSDEATFNGNKVPAGEYAILSIPNKNEWTIILSKDLKTTEQSYTKDNDVLRFTVKPMAISPTVETFTIDFSNITPNTADLNIYWENVKAVVKIETDVDGKVMTQIKEKVLNNASASVGDMYTAAVYYLDNGKDLKQAQEWMNKATEKDPKFWQMYHKARLLEKLKDYKGAETAAKKSIELAKAANNADYVQMNEKLLAGLFKK